MAWLVRMVSKLLLHELVGHHMGTAVFHRDVIPRIATASGILVHGGDNEHPTAAEDFDMGS